MAWNTINTYFEIRKDMELDARLKRCITTANYNLLPKTDREYLLKYLRQKCRTDNIDTSYIPKIRNRVLVFENTNDLCIKDIGKCIVTISEDFLDLRKLIQRPLHKLSIQERAALSYAVSNILESAPPMALLILLNKYYREQNSKEVDTSKKKPTNLQLVDSLLAAANTDSDNVDSDNVDSDNVNSDNVDSDNVEVRRINEIRLTHEISFETFLYLVILVLIEMAFRK